MCQRTFSPPEGLGGIRVRPSALVGSWNGTILVRLSTHQFEFEARSADFEPPEPTTCRFPVLSSSEPFYIPINAQTPSIPL